MSSSTNDNKALKAKNSISALEEDPSKKNFIRHIIADDLSKGTHQGQVITRFPPEPNGYLHIGHAKSICLNFGLAEENEKGTCHLRFDDSNPTKEKVEYAEAIQRDIRWLGFEWGEHFYHTSDYFEQLYKYAEYLIEKGRAFVCDLNAEDTRKLRGSLTETGQNSPYRDRSVEENLELFRAMRAGKFQNGDKVLRAKIDMGSPNLNMRDPVIYRILHAEHFRTGNEWCIYPMYDFCHGLSDYVEKITHSLCTLEFEDHRPLYDWFLEALDLPLPRPRQIEFARLNLEYTVMSKRKFIQLVEDGHVSGWDDPRMPTLSGMRRRGFPAQGIRQFAERVGVSKKNNTVDMSLLENCVRDTLNTTTPRYLGVIDPLKVTLTNLAEGETHKIEAPLHPQEEKWGTRELLLTRNLWIDRSDFMLDPPKKFFRLGPERYVRLRYGFVIRCHEVVKNEAGDVVELKCEYFPETLGGKPLEGVKVKGIIHWVSEENAIDHPKVNLYDRLFICPFPGKESGDFIKDLNPNSLKVLEGAKLEKALLAHKEGAFQLERVGYFCFDEKDSSPKNPVLNKIVGLRDTWKK